MKKKVALIILDGLAYGKKDQTNAVHVAQTPFLDSLIAKYPNGKLFASGEEVGLPKGQMGNSEVGHMNLGAGRVVYQELGRINKALEEGVFKTHTDLVAAFEYVKKENKKLHLIGLLSDGGVHSHINHLKGLCDAAEFHQLTDDQVFIHAFTDGRDTDPQGGKEYIKDLQEHLKNSTGKLASVIGRYYSMDRDNRWERIKLAYDLLIHGKGEYTASIEDAIQKSYDEGVTDEFIQPLKCLDSFNNPLPNISPEDVVIFYNFRTDRGRELTSALTQQAFPEHEMYPLNLKFYTMTSYDDHFKNIQVLFNKDNLNNTLGEVIANNHLTQVRIAETEKYPHVTFFFSGGREEPFEGERRILIPSPKVPTYDLKPEMSAPEIAEAICLDIGQNQPDFICLNFANPDMVGHTGNFNAVVHAVETVDKCLEKVVNKGLEYDYSFIILADHGNADFMVNEDGSPNTAHTTNLVPCILIDREIDYIKPIGKLGDIAPTLLDLLKVEIPLDMTGESLVTLHD